MSTLTDDEVRALLEKIRQLETQLATTAGDDWTAIDPVAWGLSAPEGLFKRHKYDIGSVAPSNEHEWPGLFVANPFIEVPLKTKRQEIAAIMRFSGVSVKPAWFEQTVNAMVHNAGIDRRIATLQAQIAALNGKRE